jgi:hypothetical protein
MNEEDMVYPPPMPNDYTTDELLAANTLDQGAPAAPWEGAPGESPTYGGGWPYPHEDPVHGYGDRLALALQDVQMPAFPTTRYKGQPSGAGAAFLTGLLSGGAQGFSRGRMQQISEREKLNQALAQKTHDENMANLAATRATQAEAAQTRAGERALGRTKELELFKRRLPVAPADDVVTEADAKVNPWLKPAIGWKRSTAIAAFAPKNEAGEPLYAVKTPKGVRYVPRSKAAGMEPATGPGAKPPSPIQQAAKAFYNRANNAVDTISKTTKGQKSLEDRIASLSTREQFALRAPNFMQSPDIQAYNQAKKVFAGALLRKESGAAINAQEYRDIDQSFFIQPGDAPSTIEQKRQARKVAIEGLKLQSTRSSVDTSNISEEEKDAIYQEIVGGQ